ncbi:hypothetical protein CRG98_005688 [Punica granatum]|uniref:Uncharacterized protein n=1 Tax=Punica granatum TaxID=22663 RepID=A0A2I0KZL5_PUNGR|nr:hypothetical protein CRG98_005688 [Punica granatum]
MLLLSPTTPPPFYPSAPVHVPIAPNPLQLSRLSRYHRNLSPSPHTLPLFSVNPLLSCERRDYRALVLNSVPLRWWRWSETEELAMSRFLGVAQGEGME